MKQRVVRMAVVAPLAVLIGLLSSGCVTSNGLLTSLADDLAFATAAAAEGLVAGTLQNLLGL